MKKVIMFSLFILTFSASILSQEVASTRLQGMGIGTDYLIEDYETDILKFPVVASHINKRYGVFLFNPFKFNYNRFTFLEKINKTLYGIHLGHENGFGWNENIEKKKTNIQVLFGNDKNLFEYKISKSEIEDHKNSSYINDSGWTESISIMDNKSFIKNFEHLITYSTISSNNELLLNISLGYIANKTIFDNFIYKSRDAFYDSLETDPYFVYYSDFDHVIFYEYDISENGSSKSSEFTINLSAQMEQKFLKRFPTNLYGEIGWIHSNLNSVSGNYITNEHVRYLAQNNHFEPDSIVIYTRNENYDLKKKKGNKLIVVIGSGTLYQLSKKMKLFITGKSFLNYELIDDTFINEQNDEILKEKNRIFRYEGFTNFGCEYVISNKFTIRTGSSWIIAGTSEKINGLKYRFTNISFTPELRLKILTGVSYSYSDNLNFDMAVNMSNRSEELFISTIYKF